MTTMDDDDEDDKDDDDEYDEDDDDDVMMMMRAGGPGVPGGSRAYRRATVAWQLGFSEFLVGATRISENPSCKQMAARVGPNGVQRSRLPPVVEKRR